MDTLFFIISKIAWVLLSPINLTLILLVLGGMLSLWFSQKLGKILFAVGTIVGLSIMTYPIGDWLITPLEKRFPQQTLQTLPNKIDGIILLGGGEELARSLSWKMPQLEQGGDRYIAAKYLSNLYPTAPIIFSGGSGNPLIQQSAGEGSIAKELLTMLGIDKKRLIIESRSRNTYENFKLVKPLLPKAEGRYILITSAFHMPRSVGIARQQGIHVIAYPTDYRSFAPAYRHFDFKTYDHLHSLEPAVREWIGLTVYYLTGKTNAWLPKPNEDNNVIPVIQAQPG